MNWVVCVVKLWIARSEWSWPTGLRNSLCLFDIKLFSHRNRELREPVDSRGSKPLRCCPVSH